MVCPVSNDSKTTVVWDEEKAEILAKTFVKFEKNMELIAKWGQQRIHFMQKQNSLNCQKISHVTFIIFFIESFLTFSFVAVFMGCLSRTRKVWTTLLKSAPRSLESSWQACAPSGRNRWTRKPKEPWVNLTTFSHRNFLQHPQDGAILHLQGRQRDIWTLLSLQLSSF